MGNRGSAVPIGIRAPARERPIAKTPTTQQDLFRSTLPRGERHKTQFVTSSGSLFRSALPRGSDSHDQKPACHRFDPRSPPAGATLQLHDVVEHLVVSIRLPHGSDPLMFNVPLLS
jgi:hypothetical protein